MPFYDVKNQYCKLAFLAHLTQEHHDDSVVGGSRWCPACTLTHNIVDFAAHIGGKELSFWYSHCVLSKV